MSILKVAQEQSVFKFTGKINLLLKDNGKFIGAIFQKNGQLVNCVLGTFEGNEALLCLIQYDYLNQGSCRYIIEPEIVAPFNQAFDIESMAAHEKWIGFKKLYEKSICLRPSNKIKLRAKSDFFEKNTSINQNEYIILSKICDHPLVLDLYNNINLPEYIITICLVSLRKKGALIVCKNVQ